MLMAPRTMFLEGTREPENASHPKLWWTDDFFIDSILQFASVTVHWNCSGNRFCSPKYDFWGPRDLRKFPWLAITCHIWRPPHRLWYNSTTVPDPLVNCEGVSPPTPHPSRRLWRLNSWRLWRLELGPPVQTIVTPLYISTQTYSCASVADTGGV